MKILLKERSLPDGRVVYYHTVAEVVSDFTDNITNVILKSYTLDSDAFSLQVPDATFSIVIPNSFIQNTPDYINQLDTYLNTLPEWQGISEYIDKSVPVIPETVTTQNIQQNNLLVNIGVPTWLINT